MQTPERDRDWDPRQVCYSVPQLLPIIFRISRNMRIQDAGPLTLLRSKSNFSSKAITIHITRVIPCLACRQSPSALRSLGMDQKLTLWYKSEYLLLVERTVIPERTQRRWEENANVTSKRTSSPYEWRLLLIPLPVGFVLILKFSLLPLWMTTDAAVPQF